MISERERERKNIVHSNTIIDQVSLKEIYRIAYDKLMFKFVETYKIYTHIYTSYKVTRPMFLFYLPGRKKNVMNFDNLVDYSHVFRIFLSPIPYL